MKVAKVSTASQGCHSSGMATSVPSYPRPREAPGPFLGLAAGGRDMSASLGWSTVPDALWRVLWGPRQSRRPSRLAGAHCTGDRSRPEPRHVLGLFSSDKCWAGRDGSLVGCGWLLLAMSPPHRPRHRCMTETGGQATDKGWASGKTRRPALCDRGAAHGPHAAFWGQNRSPAKEEL